MVESQPSKLLVASSILVSRSNSSDAWICQPLLVGEHVDVPAIRPVARGTGTP